VSPDAATVRRRREGGSAGGRDFSIVIPTYRRPAALARCLEALARLDRLGPSFEVLVVDDGGGLCESQLPAACGELPWKLVRQPHAGPAAARNGGARAASGRWLAFTDDDCEPRPDWLVALAAGAERHPRAWLCGVSVNALRDDVLASAHESLVESVCGSREEGGEPRLHFAPSNNLAMPAADFREVGGFDESFPFAAGEDRDLCWRWTARGGQLATLPEARVDHRHGFGLASYCRMHVRYGRGARRFRRLQALARSERVRLESWRFYFNLVVRPLRAPRARRSGAVCAALALSQLFHTAGYAWEWATESSSGGGRR